MNNTDLNETIAHAAPLNPDAGDARTESRTLRLLRRVWRDEGIRAAAFAFLLTRLLVLTLWTLTTHITHFEPTFGGEVREVNVSLRNGSVAASLTRAAATADGNWYIDIATNGYERTPFADDNRQHNWAFFPLYPLLLRLSASLTGEFALTGVALSNLLLLFALIVLHKTALAFGLDMQAAERAVFYTAAFPVSYFFSLPMTESLFLLLSLSSVLLAKRSRWWWAGACGALATATRLSGMVLLPTLLVLYWSERRSRGSTNAPRFSLDSLGIALVPAGLFAFMFWLHSVIGNPLAFVDVQSAWNRGTGLFVVPLIEYMTNPLNVLTAWDFRALNFAAALLAFACGGVLARRRQWALAVFTVISIVLPLSSLSLQSLARYTMVIFPVALVLAEAGRAPGVDRLIRFVFVALLGLMSMFFAARFAFTLS
jgi:hypothetical protein